MRFRNADGPKFRNDRPVGLRFDRSSSVPLHAAIIAIEVSNGLSFSNITEICFFLSGQDNGIWDRSQRRINVVCNLLGPFRVEEALKSFFSVRPESS